LLKQWNELQVNLCQKLFFLQNMGRTCCVQKLFWMSETISVHNMFSPGLSLEFSRTYWTCNSINNLSSYCGLVDARIGASEKDLHKTPLIGAHRGFIGLHTSLQKNYYNLQLSSHLACERIQSCKSMKPFDSFDILQGKYTVTVNC
jgi:hypothetical protein